MWSWMEHHDCENEIVLWPTSPSVSTVSLILLDNLARVVTTSVAAVILPLLLRLGHRA